MKLSIQGIKDKEAWEKAGIKLPSYDVEKVATATKEAPVWVHFGIGNIFRIFIRYFKLTVPFCPIQSRYNNSVIIRN